MNADNNSEFELFMDKMFYCNSSTTDTSLWFIYDVTIWAVDVNIVLAFDSWVFFNE